MNEESLLEDLKQEITRLRAALHKIANYTVTCHFDWSSLQSQARRILEETARD